MDVILEFVFALFVRLVPLGETISTTKEADFGPVPESQEADQCELHLVDAA